MAQYTTATKNKTNQRRTRIKGLKKPGKELTKDEKTILQLMPSISVSTKPAA